MKIGLAGGEDVERWGTMKSKERERGSESKPWNPRRSNISVGPWSLYVFQ